MKIRNTLVVSEFMISKETWSIAKTYITLHTYCLWDGILSWFSSYCTLQKVWQHFLHSCGWYNIRIIFVSEPVTVAGRSEACTVFARSEAGIVGSNPTQGMDVWCVCTFFCECVVLCLGRGLATSWSLVQGVLPSANDQETEKSTLCSKSGSNLPNGSKEEESKIVSEPTLIFPMVLSFMVWNLAVVQWHRNKTVQGIRICSLCLA
jgi:hypothetical protein